MTKAKEKIGTGQLCSVSPPQEKVINATHWSKSYHIRVIKVVERTCQQHTEKTAKTTAPNPATKAIIINPFQKNNQPTNYKATHKKITN